MRVFAYCDQTWANSMKWIAGVEPLTCPPMDSDKFDPRWLESQELILIDLHGEPGLDYWYAVIDEPGGIPERVTALYADQIRQADLGGAVVFATSCYLGEEGNPMLAALLAAGAGYVIGGAGENYAGARKLAGAGLLAMFFRMYLEVGADPMKALATGKTTLGLIGRDAQVKQDTLAFQIFGREEDVA